MVVGALRIACNGLCTAARFHKAEEDPGCPLECHDGLHCIRQYNRCPSLIESLCSLGPECISPAAIFNDLPFKIAVRSDWLCIHVAVLHDAFVTAYTLQTNRGPGLNFKELMYGVIKMMTALCPAWAHTYQTMSLGFHPEHLRLEAFRLPKPKKKKFTMLPTCRTTTRTRLESSLPAGDSSQMEVLKRHVDGTEMAGWGLPLFRLKTLFESFAAQFLCDPRLPVFLGATPCSSNTADLTGWLKPLGGLISSFLAVNVCASFLIPNTRPVSRLVLLTQKKKHCAGPQMQRALVAFDMQVPHFCPSCF